MVFLKCAKEFAVHFSQHVVLASIDDKAIIPVWEPSAAVSTGVRDHHRSLVPSSSFLGALDHDFHMEPVEWFLLWACWSVYLTYTSGQSYPAFKPNMPLYRAIEDPDSWSMCWELCDCSSCSVRWKTRSQIVLWLCPDKSSCLVPSSQLGHANSCMHMSLSKLD